MTKEKKPFLRFNTSEFSWWQTALGTIGIMLFIGASMKVSEKLFSGIGNLFGGYSKEETSDTKEFPLEQPVQDNVFPFQQAK
jgi:hypothetical protein